MNIQTELKLLIEQLHEKQEQLEDARKKDAVFEETKRLFLEMKELNQRIQKCIEKSNIDPLQ
jgi:hypothetical protein